MSYTHKYAGNAERARITSAISASSACSNARSCWRLVSAGRGAR